jgi:hypothetical protein
MKVHDHLFFNPSSVTATSVAKKYATANISQQISHRTLPRMHFVNQEGRHIHYNKYPTPTPYMYGIQFNYIEMCLQICYTKHIPKVAKSGAK